MEKTEKDNVVALVKIYRLKGEIFCLLDAPKKGREWLEKCLVCAGELEADEGENIIFMEGTLEQQKRLQALHGTLNLVGAPGLTGRHKAICLTIIKECCKAYDRLARILFQTGEPLRGMYAVYRSVNLGEFIGRGEELAKAYATIAFIKKSARYAKLAKEASKLGGASVITEAFVSMLLGGMLVRKKK